jgi:endonuclease/exonuclease/phosphatase family metal-dependent hydrolase
MRRDAGGEAGEQSAHAGQAGQPARETRPAAPTAASVASSEAAGDAASAATRAAPAAAPPSLPHLRVVSANLFRGAVDPGWLLDLVQAMHADVVCLQEAHPRHVEALARVLPHGRFDEGDDNGMGIALRNPAAVAPVPMSWRHAQYAHLLPAAWPQLAYPIDLMNLHVAAPHTGVPPLRSFVMRRRQVRAIEAHYDTLPGHGPYAPHRGEVGRGEARRGEPPCGALLVGDFNATPRWPAYRRLVERFSDAAVAVARRLERPVERTWGPWPGSPRLLRIDHGLMQGLAVREFQVVALARSDHSAIVVDVETPA